MLNSARTRNLLATIVASTASVAEAQVVFEVEGLGSNQTLGLQLVGVGDVNSDGVPDFAAASNEDDTFGARVRVYSGANGQLITQIIGSAADCFGQAIAAGDVTANGYLDLVIAAPKATSSSVVVGKVSVFNPLSGASSWQAFSTAQNSQPFRTLAVIADRNGDGRSEVLVGSPFTSTGSALEILDGATGATLSTVVATAINLGQAVTAMDDIDGDSIVDYAASATLIGKVTIRSGLDDSVLRTINWPAGGLFGASLAGIGDATGDGTMDLVVGSPNNNISGYQSGAAVLISGATGGAQKLLLASDLPGAIQLGYAVAPAGDVDGDGLADVLVSAPYPNFTGPIGGYVRMYSGANGDVLRTYTHPHSNAYFGLAIAAIGDRDGDGIGEFAAGAPYWGTTQFTNEGLVQSIDPKCATKTENGTPCPNPSTMIAASVTITGCLKPSASITLTLGGHAGATAFLLIGTPGGPTSIGATACALHLGSLLPIVFAVPMPNGSGAVSLPIPVTLPASLGTGSIGIQVFDGVGSALYSASAATVLSIH